MASAALLAGCGDASTPAAEKKPSPVATTTAPAATSPTPKPVKPMPRCGKVWVAGKRLPGGYRGCAPAGVLPAVDRYYCESGQVLVTFQNHYYAAKTGKIFYSDDVRHDSSWHRKLTTCRG